MSELEALNTVILVLQIGILTLVLLRSLLGKSDGEKLVRYVKKSLEYLNRFKHLGNIAEFTQEILEMVTSGKVNEQQMMDLAKYVKTIVGG